ncbi:MAG: ABC transporter permease, partial [Propionibacteriaceae bacterium]|nr:ABC transporter permease [Propionibacteriaceae bacterium]
QSVFAGGALLLLVAVIAVGAGWLPVSFVAAAGGATWLLVGMAVVAVVGMVLLLRVAISRLEQIRRARLLSGGSLVSGMQGAMFALDFGLIRDILVERKMVAKGHVKPTRGRGLGLAALIWRDAERLKRNPAAFLGLAASLFVPYAADALRVVQLNPLVSGLALVAGLVPFLGSLRVLSRTGGLARSFPFKTAQLRTASMAVPAVLALLWGLAASPAFIGIARTGADRSVIDGVVAALVTALAGLLGAVRWTTAKKVDFGTPMMATESGAMPPTLLFNLFRGLDMVALVTAPLILQAPAYWSLAIALVVFVALRGSFNPDELRAEQEAAKRELEASKKAKADKQKIPRPSR